MTARFLPICRHLHVLGDNPSLCADCLGGSRLSLLESAIALTAKTDRFHCTATGRIYLAGTQLLQVEVPSAFVYADNIYKAIFASKKQAAHELVFDVAIGSGMELGERSGHDGQPLSI